MGYKLAGCNVIGCLEIDKRMNDIYVLNHKPKYNYLMDIRDFNKLDNLPQELYELDILDGSPPCTTFSMAGEREKTWGVEKKFREGQAEQTLDDLSFVFIDTVAKLKPKTVIIENVKGLILGDAWSYVQEIYKKFKDIGYTVRHWLLKGETMGVPQTRHRVFFVATRLDFDLNSIDMSFDYETVTYGEIKSGIGDKLNQATKIARLLNKSLPHDTSLESVQERVLGKKGLFNYIILQDDRVFPTMSAGSAVTPMRHKEKTYCTIQDLINAQTFPQDYNFIQHTRKNVQYVCGMSVPPLMTKRVVTKIIESGLLKE